MNENNEGTPNPLNPNPAPASAPTPAPTPTPASAPAPKPVLETEPLAKVDPESTVEIETAHEAATNPMNRPMEQAPTSTAEQPKKKKTGLIIGILASLLVATGCGVAAVLLFANNGDDAVAKALNKLASGDTPSNISIDGTIGIAPHNTTSQVTNLKLDLKSDLVTGSMINSTVANLTIEAKNNKSFSAELDEIYGADGDLFFKISGASELLKNASVLQSMFGSEPTVVDCDTLGAGEEVDCTETIIEEETVLEEEEVILDDELAEYDAIVKMFDEKWLRVSGDEISALTSDESGQAELSCVVDLVKGANNSGNSLAEYYSRNPFIVSSNKDLAVSSKANPIYQISVDTEKFTDFINAIKTSELMTKINSCLSSTEATIDTDEALEAVKKLPAIYVEVDNNYNFTRLYFVKDLEDDTATVTVDLNFGYPTNVNISEPVEYQDLSTLFQGMFSNATIDVSTDEKVEVLPTE